MPVSSKEGKQLFRLAAQKMEKTLKCFLFISTAALTGLLASTLGTGTTDFIKSRWMT